MGADVRAEVGSRGGMTAVLLINGIMDLRAMALVTAAITAEPVARAIGVAVMVMGLTMTVQVIGLR